MFAWTGCDSNEEEGNGGDESDADLLVGIWNATSVKVGETDILQLAGVEMILTLEANGDAQIDVIDESGDVSGVVGTYVVDENAKTITLDGDDVDNDVVLPYMLIDENTLTLVMSGSDLADLGFDLGPIGDFLEDKLIDVELARDGN